MIPTQQRQQATLARRIAKERDKAERALWHVSNREFDCEDAIHEYTTAQRCPYLRCSTAISQADTPTEQLHSPKQTYSAR